MCVNSAKDANPNWRMYGSGMSDSGKGFLAYDVDDARFPVCRAELVQLVQVDSALPAELEPVRVQLHSSQAGKIQRKLVSSVDVAQPCSSWALMTCPGCKPD